nr:MAG TPA: hypothetical protein [Caudoviricetes sp.]
MLLPMSSITGHSIHSSEIEGRHGLIHFYCL